MGIKTARIKFEGDVLELLITFESRIPDEFGFYCHVCFEDVYGSYTMVPITVVHELPNTALFKIKKSIFTDKLLKFKIENEDYFLDNHSSVDDALYGYVEMSVRALEITRFRFTGPFHSTHMSIKDKSQRNLIVLVSGSGISVADSILQFYYSRPNYWHSVSIVMLCGRKITPTAQDLMKMQISFRTILENNTKNEASNNSTFSFHDTIMETDLIGRLRAITCHSSTDHVNAQDIQVLLDVCIYIFTL
jgi:hypothetical protein